MVKTSSSSLEGAGSIPGWGAKIATCLVAKKPKHNQQKQHCKKSNKCFKNGPNKKILKKKIRKKERERLAVKRRWVLDRKDCFAQPPGETGSFLLCGRATTPREPQSPSPHLSEPSSLALPSLSIHYVLFQWLHFLFSSFLSPWWSSDEDFELPVPGTRFQHWSGN